MGIPPVRNGSRAELLLNKFIFPILMFLTALSLIVHDAVIAPPTEMQGETGAAFVLIALATGKSFDIKKFKGGG